MLWTGRLLMSVLVMIAEMSMPVCGLLPLAQTEPATAIAAIIVTATAYMRP